MENPFINFKLSERETIFSNESAVPDQIKELLRLFMLCGHVRLEETRHEVYPMSSAFEPDLIHRIFWKLDEFIQTVRDENEEMIRHWSANPPEHYPLQDGWQEAIRSDTKNDIDAILRSMEPCEIPMLEQLGVRTTSKDSNSHILVVTYGLRLIDEALSAIFENRPLDAFDKIAEASIAIFHAKSWVEGNVFILTTNWFNNRHAEWGRKGAAARADKYAPVKEKLFEHYRSRRWPSPHAASFMLSGMAIDESKKHGCPLSVQRAQKTVHEWLLQYERNRTPGSQTGT